MVRKIAVQHDGAKKVADQKTEFILPRQILTAADVLRLSNELEELEEFFTRGAIKGADAKELPQFSKAMATIIESNTLNMLHKDDRERLKLLLEGLIKNSPVVHLSFAAEPKPEFLMKLIDWFRREAHPYLLFKIGLRPAIAAGCIVRTTNKSFDLSFKQRFSDSKEKLAVSMGAKR